MVREYGDGRNLFRDIKEVRPAAFRGCANQAIIIEDNVYEINLCHVEFYESENNRERSIGSIWRSGATDGREKGRFLEQ